MIWHHLQKQIGNSFKTLEQKRVFEVRKVSDDRVVIWIVRSKKERKISRKEIEGAYQALMASRVITRNEIQAKYSPRNPAYVAALLASESDVDYSLKPITLILR